MSEAVEEVLVNLLDKKDNVYGPVKEDGGKGYSRAFLIEAFCKGSMR